MMTNTGATGDGQVQVLQSKLPQASGDNSKKPRMPFLSDLSLTRVQEDAMVEHVCQRIDQIEAQMGKKEWNRSGGDFQVASDADSWLGKREKFTARYYNHVGDRRQPNTVYFHSNWTASLSQRITAQMIAEAVSFYFGEPDDHDWFVADPIGIEDQVLADKIRKYARWKAAKCGIKRRFIQGTEFAFVRGEAVKKILHEERFQVFERTDSILVDTAKGAAIFNSFGDYITAEDLWTDEMEEIPVSMVPPEKQHLAVQEAETQEGVEPTAAVPTGRAILKKDGVTVRPDAPIFESRKVPRKRVTFHGPSSELCYYRDFIAPLDAPGLQAGEADLVAHLYDRTIMQIVGMFSAQFEAGEKGLGAMQKAVNALHDMIQTAGTEPRSDVGAPREEWGERDTEQSPNNPTVQLAECWLTYDANNDGQEEEILLIIDRRNKAPIFYEYTCNVTLKGLRPFEVDRAIEVDGRWWGMGAMEYFSPEQEFIDLQLNRMDFRDSKAGRVTLWRPHNTVEGDRDPNLVLNDGSTYTPKENKKDSDILSYIVLPEAGANLMELLQLFMQFMQVKSGVMNGADQAVSGMPSNETLGEQQLITNSGDKLFAMFLVRLYKGHSGAIEQVMDVMFSKLDRREVFTYFNGDAQDILELTPDEVRDLTLNVTLSITRQRDRQVLAAGAQAAQLLEKYYSLPFILQERFKEYYRGQLKALRVSQGDKLIEPLDPAMMMQPVIDQQTGALPQGQSLPPNEPPV
jgi:hypothetical protein